MQVHTPDDASETAGFLRLKDAPATDYNRLAMLVNTDAVMTPKGVYAPATLLIRPVEWTPQDGLILELLHMPDEVEAVISAGTIRAPIYEECELSSLVNRGEWVTRSSVGQGWMPLAQNKPTE